MAPSLAAIVYLKLVNAIDLWEHQAIVLQSFCDDIQYILPLKNKNLWLRWWTCFSHKRNSMKGKTKKKLNPSLLILKCINLQLRGLVHMLQLRHIRYPMPFMEGSHASQGWTIHVNETIPQSLCNLVCSKNGNREVKTRKLYFACYLPSTRPMCIK